MNIPMGELSSLDIILRNPISKNVLMLSSVSNLESDPIAFKGVLQTFDGRARMKVSVDVPHHQFAKLSLTYVSMSELLLVDNLGNETGYKIRNYSSTEAIAGRYVIASGRLITPQNTEADFVVAYDVGPVVVVAVVALVYCLATYLIDKIFGDCRANMKAAIDACEKAHGFPEMDNSFTIGLSGCTITCKLICHPPAVEEKKPVTAPKSAPKE
jgi:hypothetical protein